MQVLSSLYRSLYGQAPEVMVPITGSASNRSYYRLSSSSGSCVGVVGLDRAENHAFLTIASHFHSKGINVPEILAVSDDGMRYLQEDLGTDVLYDMYARTGMTKETEALLCSAMAALPRMRLRALTDWTFPCAIPSLNSTEEW